MIRRGRRHVPSAHGAVGIQAFVPAFVVQEMLLQRQLLALQQHFLHEKGWHECLDAKGDVSRRDMPSTTPYHLATCYQGLIQHLG